MGLGLFFFKLINREYYKTIPLGLLVLNWITQRIFRINSEVPFSVHYTSKVSGFNYINIDERSKLSFGVSGGAYIVATKEAPIHIGKNVIFAFNFCIQTINHDFLNRNIYKYKPVRIGDNCWFGNSVSVVPGVTLGNNVTVGANSVVTKSFPDNVVIAGCPAKIIKTI